MTLTNVSASPLSQKSHGSCDHSSAIPGCAGSGSIFNRPRTDACTPIRSRAEPRFYRKSPPAPARSPACHFHSFRMEDHSGPRMENIASRAVAPPEAIFQAAWQLEFVITRSRFPGFGHRLFRTNRADANRHQFSRHLKEKQRSQPQHAQYGTLFRCRSSKSIGLRSPATVQGCYIWSSGGSAECLENHSPARVTGDTRTCINPENSVR